MTDRPNDHDAETITMRPLEVRFGRLTCTARVSSNVTDEEADEAFRGAVLGHKVYVSGHAPWIVSDNQRVCVLWVIYSFARGT